MMSFSLFFISVKPADSLTEYLANMQSGVFEGNLMEANVFALLMTTFRDIIQNYPEGLSTANSASTAMQWAKNIIIFDSNANILAQTFGVIVNGYVKIPAQAFSILDEFFQHAFSVSLK